MKTTEKGRMYSGCFLKRGRGLGRYMERGIGGNAVGELHHSGSHQAVVLMSSYMVMKKGGKEK